MNNSQGNSKTRNYDAESGKNRVSTSRKKPSTKVISSDSEPEYVNSDLENEQEMPAKDDTVRKVKPSKSAKPTRVANHGVSGIDESGSDLAESKKRETGESVAPHMLMLLSATYHLGFSSITRPAISTYYPSCANFFTMAYCMMSLVSENTYLQEMCPSFFSVSFYTYCGYLYFYQILRAKDEVGRGQLSRSERRVLRHLKNIGEPEAWPVPSPLIEFIRSFGYYKSSNQAYSFVVPSFPVFTHVSRPAGNTTSLGYSNFHNVPGIQRIPPISAYVEFLFNFGNRVSAYNAEQGWIPTAQPELSENNSFISLVNSTAANGNAFHALTFCDGWREPTEGEMRWGPIQAAVKRQNIRRWTIPRPANSTRINIENIELFTCLHDEVNTAWIRELITQSNILTRFFPGSTTLAAIPPVSHLGNLTAVAINSTIATPIENHQWYPHQGTKSFEYMGYDDTEQGRILARIGLATMTNNERSDQVIPIGTRSAGRAGPFFVDDTENPVTERMETFRFTGSTESDPTGRFSEQLSALYDAKGGRS